MAIQPKAKNTLNTSLLYENRLLYKYAYPSQYENNIDLWNVSSLYGKVDLELDHVYLKPQYLKVINNNVVGKSTPLYAAAFVVDAYKEFIEEVRRADQYQRIPKSLLNPLSVKRAAIVPEEQYKNRIKQILDVLLLNDLKALENKILTFDDFLRLFINNFSITKISLSQTANIGNIAFSPNATGLMLEVGTLEHDDDEKKVQLYLQDVNYQFFINTAEKYSFYVDKNAPWRMTFNVNTQYALDKFKIYNVNTIQEMFNLMYTKSYNTDYKLLKQYMIDYYSNNVLKKQKTQVYEYDDCNRTTKLDTVFKQTVDQIEKPDVFWIQLYYFIRLKEQKINMFQSEFDNQLKKLATTYKVSGEQVVLGWINSQTKFVVDGGTNPDYNEFVRLKKAEAAKNKSFTFKL
jgi:hypothetical protein